MEERQVDQLALRLALLSHFHYHKLYLPTNVQFLRATLCVCWKLEIMKGKL